MELNLPALKAANEAYQQGAFQSIPRTPQPGRHLVVLTCMDARLDPLRSLGLQVGEAHILRNAGGRATPDAIRSLVVSAHLLDTRELAVIHHTRCGMEGITDADIAQKTGASGMTFYAFDDVEASVVDDIHTIRQQAPLPAGFTAWGAVYDVDTGALRVVVEPAEI